MSTHAEFYGKNGEYLIATVNDVGAVPVVGHLINIRKVTYNVIDITWCVDHAGSLGFTEKLRVNITLEKV